MKMLHVVGGILAFCIFCWFYVHGSVLLCQVKVATIDFVRDLGTVLEKLKSSLALQLYQLIALYQLIFLWNKA